MATYTINKFKSPEGDIYNLQDASALHSIPVATTETVGGVKAGGTGISIDANGVISSTATGQMVWWGTCNTSASSQVKIVSCSGFTLTTGAIIGVLFTTGNTYTSTTALQLNVNSTGVKDVVLGHSSVNSTNILKWSANTVLYFMYNGVSYEYITAVSGSSVEQPRGSNTWYGTSSTAAGTTAKTSTIANYVLTKGSVVYVTFTYANTADAPTLNINSTGAKAIYYNNAVTSSSNKLTWDAGETVTFIYSGSYYYFVTKSKSSVDISGKVDKQATSGSYRYTIDNTSSGAVIGSDDATAGIANALVADNTGIAILSDNGSDSSSILVNSSSIDIGTTGSSAVYISNLVVPTNDSDAANKNYVDSQINLHPGTVTSVRVQGTAPISSSVSTAQTGSLDTTISISDATTTASGAMSAADKTKLDSLPGQMVWWGTCSDDFSGNRIKYVSCSGFTLTTGAIIGVLFTIGNTYTASTAFQLNVNSTGAKDVVLGHSSVNSTTNVLKWSANTVLYFMYNGTSFEYITSVSAASVEQPRGANTWYGTSSTAAGIIEKTSTIANYVLTKGSVVCVTFTYANTADAPTLNINGTGAKAIYYNNAVTSSSNKLTWDAGETVTFIYSGSYYHFVTKSSDYLGPADKSKLDKISFPESPISDINNLEFDCTPSDPGIRIRANYGNDTYQSSLYYISNDGPSSGYGNICGTSDFVTPNTSCVVYDPRSTAGLARTETVGSTTSYINGYMTGQDKEKLDKVNLATDSDVTVLTNGIKSNNVNSGVQQWRLFLGDYASTQNYGVNSKTIMGLKGDNAVGDGLLFASYSASDGTLDGKVAIGSTGIRSRDSSGSVAWDIDVPISLVELGQVTGSADSISLWRGWDNATFGDYMGIGAQKVDGTDGFRMYFGQNAWRFRTYAGTTGGADAWWMFPSRIPQFNNNTSTTVSSVTSTYTYTGATSSSGTAYWYYYMDDSHIYGWVRLNCGNATSSTSKSTVLNLPTAFTSGITIATGANDGGRFFITPFGTNGGTVDRMWVNAYTATNVTVNCTVASANTTAIPMNMMFFFNYTKNS